MFTNSPLLQFFGVPWGWLEIVDDPNLTPQFLAVCNARAPMPMAVAEIEISISVVRVFPPNSNVSLVGITMVEPKRVKGEKRLDHSDSVSYLSNLAAQNEKFTCLLDPDQRS